MVGQKQIWVHFNGQKTNVGIDQMSFLLNLNSCFCPLAKEAMVSVERLCKSLTLSDTFSLELEDVEEAALIDLMCCSCKQAATGIPPPGRSAYKKVSSFIYEGNHFVLWGL